MFVEVAPFVRQNKSLAKGLFLYVLDSFCVLCYCKLYASQYLFHCKVTIDLYICQRYEILGFILYG